MTEKELIEYVQENARYHEGQDEPYAITYLGEPYWDESPRGLVLQIMEAISAGGDRLEKEYIL